MAGNNSLAFLNNAGAGPGGKTTIKMEVTDYGFHQNNVLAAEWVDEDGKVYAHDFTPAELGDELEYQGFCANAYVDANAQAVCDMTDFLGYKPGELVTPRELWQTLAADQREKVVRGLIEQLKSEQQ